MDEAVRLAEAQIQEGSKGYVCVTGVHGVMEAQTNPSILGILNRALITTPDGMPTVWVGRLQGYRDMRRVYGPDYMLELCQVSVNRGYKHFLYGGKEHVAERLAAVLIRRFPGLRIVGTFTPPFRALNAKEEAELIAQVAAAKPDIIWVGLSTPKQEQFMAAYLDKLDTQLMIGVGAAFDIHTGGIVDAPQWVKISGLQWLHRLLQEPKRLWKRYLINNPRFLWKIGLQLFGIRRYEI
jgi:N-acetylglucosaminyldiphosphoundecaprenol N-acetyl-beta-D-mannosaminyltransferase